MRRWGGGAYSGEIVSSGSKEGSGLMFALPALEWLLAQGLIREQQPPLHPSPLHPSIPPLLHAAVGFSFFIREKRGRGGEGGGGWGWGGGRLIDEPLFVFQPCTFLNLKSQFILGKRRGRRREEVGGGKESKGKKERKKKLQNSPLSHTTTTSLFSAPCCPAHRVPFTTSPSLPPPNSSTLIVSAASPTSGCGNGASAIPQTRVDMFTCVRTHTYRGEKKDRKR